MSRIRWKPLYEFMRKRHEIYLKRASGAPQPWTRDPILRTYKFTNVYRELDRVTVWVRENIREPFADHPNLWFMLCIARQINWPPTLQELIADRKAWPYGVWSWKRLTELLRRRAATGAKVYTGAYMLNAHGANRPELVGHGAFDKPLFTGRLVLQSVWERRKELESRMHGSMQETTGALSECFGWAGFTSYEVACDLRYTRYLGAAPDVLTWAHAGPGAQRGICRLLGNEVISWMNREEALRYMQQLHAEIAPRWPHKPALELREIEHSLCESDKYHRTLLGEGRPRSKFVQYTGE